MKIDKSYIFMSKEDVAQMLEHDMRYNLHKKRALIDTLHPY